METLAADGNESGEERFYDRHWEHADTSADPHVVEKGRRILRMMPEGVRTIADVGCGDGYLTQRLAERYEVTAIDRSRVAVERVRSRGIKAEQASADALPLPDRSVDLAFSSQMLEHLPDETLARTARELERVARRYLFITVPYRENLRRRFVLCPTCGLEFHIDGHLHSLDGEALDRLFPAFRRIATELSGPLETPSFAAVERLRQRVARTWFLWDGAKVTCPRCGEQRFSKLQRSVLHRAADKLLRVSSNVMSVLKGQRPTPYWILAIFVRREGEAA